MSYIGAKAQGLIANIDGGTIANATITDSVIIPTSPFSFRNKIINGHLKSSKVINQRSASSITGATGYTFDRWYYDGSTYLYQGIEDANVQNGDYVISWEGSGLNAAYKVSTDSTANNGPDATTGFTSVSNGGTFTVNETTEFSKHLWIQFSGTLSNLDKVQVELGTVATDFEHRPISVELSLAQRYFEKIGYSVGAVAGTVSNRATRFPFRFAVDKRVTPSVTIVSTSNTRCNTPTDSEVYTTSVTLRATNNNTDGDDYSGQGSFTASAEL